MTTFKANRKFPNPITVTDDSKSHTLALQQIIEALNIGQRRTKEVLSSYVRVHELVDVGLIEIVGNQLKLTNLGQSVAAGASALSGLSDVDVTGLADGDVLTYNSATLKWEPVAPAVSDPFDPTDMYAAALNDLSDVAFGPPTDGDVLTWDSATQKWIASALLSNSILAPAGQVMKYQATDQSVTSSTTLVDSQLVANLQPGTYAFELNLMVANHATPDMKYTMEFTGTASAVRWDTLEAVNTSVDQQQANAFGTLPTIASTGDYGIRLFGYVVVTAAGDLKFQFAQVTSSATAITLYAGSWMRVTRMDSLEELGSSIAGYVKFPTADLSKTSDTTLAADTELDVQLSANTKYRVDYFLRIDTAATPDLKWDFNFTGTATAVFIRSENYNAATASLSSGVISTGEGFWLSSAFNTVRTHTIVGTDTLGLRITLNIEVGAAGGTLSFRWAQNTSSATSTTRKKDSSVLVVPEGAAFTETTDVQSADLTITSSTTLVNTDLVTETLDPGVYSFEAFLSYASHAAPDMKIHTNFTGTATDVRFIVSNCLAGGANSIGAAAAFGLSVLATATGDSASVLSGTFTVTVAGVFSIQVAQNTSSATSVVFEKGSWLRVKRLD